MHTEDDVKALAEKLEDTPDLWLEEDVVDWYEVARVVLEDGEERAERRKPAYSFSVTCECGHIWTIEYDKVYTIKCGECGQGVRQITEVREEPK